MLFLTAIGVYVFLKLLAEVDMLLLFLLCYYAGVWVFVFMLVERGLLAPLISLVVIIAFVATPRPFLCLRKEKGEGLQQPYNQIQRNQGGE